MRKIIYSLILLTLLFGAISALAQDNNLPSPGILPDSPFYFLKAWKETIQNFFTFGAENKAKQFLHLADVRLAEYQKMIEKGKTEIAQKTLDKYEKQLNHALQKIEELKNKGEDATSISQKAEDTINKHIEVLQGNLQKAPEAAQKGLQNAIENSSKVLEKAGGKTKKEKSCLNSGGAVTTASCCQTASDFPNTCLIGACGCSPDNSKEIKTCNCGTDKCFNGEKCASANSPIAQATYLCDGGKTIQAAFYKGEEHAVEPGQPPVPSGSVKLVLSDGRSFDLAKTLSADGGRYANADESFVFWDKGDTALVLENGAEKDYKGCLIAE
jgi:membrane-bound inhibitor of C-type lysozyme